MKINEWHIKANSASLAGFAHLAAACLILAGCSSVPTKRPQFWGWDTVVTHGDSMLPTLKNGESVRLEFCKFSDIRVNDLVIRWHAWGHEYISHRVIRGPYGELRTKGDNVANYDTETLSPENFVCRIHKL